MERGRTFQSDRLLEMSEPTDLYSTPDKGAVIEDLKRLYGLLETEDKRRFLVVLAIMTVAAVFQIAGVGAIQPFLAVMVDPTAAESGIIGTFRSFVGVTSRTGFLVVVGLTVMGLVLVSNLALSVSKWAQLRFSWDFNHTLSCRLMERYLGRDYEFYLDRNSSELSKNILSEAKRVSTILMKPVLDMLSKILVAVALFGLLLFVDPVATGIILGVVGGGYAAVYLATRWKFQRIGHRYVDANESRYQIATEGFGSIKDAKLLGREEYFLNRFEPESRQFSDFLVISQLYRQVPRYLLEMLAFGGMIGVVVFFLYNGRSPSSLVPLLGLYAFAGYRMLPALQSVLSGLSALRFNHELLKVIEEDLGIRKDRSVEIEGKANIDPLQFDERIEVDGVWYQYPSAEQPSIQNISLDIGTGEQVGIVGKTGSGKTTLVDILLGLLEPVRGEVRVDGIPIRGETAHRWQRNIGYVPQKIHLMDASVRRNIAFGVPEEEVDYDAVRRAAQIAQIADFIETELPDGYDSMVGEEGVRLSGGQRQRIGIARALYHDPGVLVFDEATSDIDGETEEQITNAIFDYGSEKTLVSVAHRLGTLRECDAIYLLEDGHIVNEGTYEELKATEVRFAKML